MRHFKDYTPTEHSTEHSTEGKNTVGGEGQAEEAAQSTAAELTKKIAAAFNGKPDASLMKSILDEAERSKREGTLTNEEIDEFYEQFSPLLNAVQRRKLKTIVEKLKRI
jgi:hypothetical protein